jgi:hypothetical protein
LFAARPYPPCKTTSCGLAGITERIAEKVLSVDFGAPVVHKTEVVTTPVARKCLPEQALRATGTDWRRGDSNPRKAVFASPCQIKNYGLSPVSTGT